MQCSLHDFIDSETLRTLFVQAKKEDFGSRGDISSELLVSASQRASGVLKSHTSGVACGVELLPLLASVFDLSLDIQPCCVDGVTISPGFELAKVSGPYRSVLSFERTSLNLLTHLSGVASITAQFVETCKRLGCSVDVCDTRKTHLGLRGVEKYAVCCGGGTPHRIGLYDAVLWKDNHIVDIPVDQLAARLHEAISKAKTLSPQPKFIEIEVDTMNQLKEVLRCAVDIVLLDNMSSEELRQAVALRDSLAPSVRLEASGGVTLDTIVGVAQSGVDRISVGRLTHSASAIDIGFDLLSVV